MIRLPISQEILEPVIIWDRLSMYLILISDLR